MSDDHAATRVRAIVRGHVQGVGFRWFVVRVATGLALHGWVMNRPDHAVELVAEGDPARVDDLLAAVREGPPSSIVQGVEVTRMPAAGDLAGFHIRSGGHPGD
ncbi:MAG: acylphosphatase [Chloroflexota bacterium]